MGRPSLADVRRPQILEAYETCLIRYGAEATTLDRVAQEAGVTRGLVRHYLGNRQDVMRALVAHVHARLTAWLDAVVADRPPSKRIDAMLDALLSGEAPENLQALATALYMEGMRDPEVASMMREMYGHFERSIDRELQAAFPRAKPQARRDVAYAIFGLTLATGDMKALGAAGHQAAARRTADLLVDTLRRPGGVAYSATTSLLSARTR